MADYQQIRCDARKDRNFPLKTLTDYKDYTMKTVLQDRPAIVRKLESLRAEYLVTDYQTDFYFKTSQGKLKYRKGNIENLITHYLREQVDGIERTTVLRYDRDPSPDKIDLLFRNHEHIGTIEKQRTVYVLSNIRIHLDKLNSGEEFIELEAIDRNNVFSDSELHGQCVSLFRQLGFDAARAIRTGYLDFH